MTQLQSVWPTALLPNGAAPTSLQLVSSEIPFLVRQGLYQMQAAGALEDRGHEVRAFQAPLTGAGVAITIPIVIAREGGPDACGYTESEEWTGDRVANLAKWIIALRRESDSAVIVVARINSALVASMPAVAEFIHLPYDNLPTASN